MWTQVPLVFVWLALRGGLTATSDLLTDLHLGRVPVGASGELLTALEDVAGRMVAQRLVERLSPVDIRGSVRVVTDSVSALVSAKRREAGPAKISTRRIDWRGEADDTDGDDEHTDEHGAGTDELT